MKKIRYWDNSLTKKLIFSYKISPIIALKDTFIRDEALKHQFRHYDPLAIALKMLELIIDNMGPFEGITKQELFNELDPLLTLMDRAKQAHLISKEDHYKILESILEKILRQKNKKGIRLEFTDYSEDPPLKRELVFRLITYRTYNNEKAVLFAEPEAVNFFIQMLDIDLEDQQQAYLKILDRQIERGDYESAIDSAKNNLRLTIQYELKIENIINQTKRNLTNLDWSNEIPKELRRAMDHINDCIKEQDFQNRKINLQLKDLGEEYFKRVILIELKELLDKSRNKLLPLQTKIDEARTTFLDEQWLQELTLRKTSKLSIETDIFDLLLNKSYNQVEKHLKDFFSFFTKISPPLLITYNQLIMQLLRKSKTKYDSFTDENLPKKTISMTELFFYPDSIKTEAVDFLRHNLSKKKKLNLDELIFSAIQETKSLLVCNYLKMLILGRFAVETFEKRLFPETINVEVIESKLQNKYFEGNNFEIQIVR